MPHNMTDRIEVRAADRTLHVAAATRRIRGIPIVFNSLSRAIPIGGGRSFKEIILPEAVDRSLRAGDEIVATFNHDDNKVLGNSRSGTLRMAKTARGLEVIIDPPDPTDPANLLQLIERGDVHGMSFRFSVPEGGDRIERRDGEIVRMVTDMTFSDVSVVTRPAYLETTVSVRSLDLFIAREVDPKIVELRAKLDQPLPWESTTRMIKQMGNEWCVFSKDGMKNMGCHPTKAKAMEHLQAIEANK